MSYLREISRSCNRWTSL